MAKEKIIDAEQFGENLVRISQKQAGKLRGLFKKVIDGLTTLPYLPGAIFKLAKEYKKAKKESKNIEYDMPENEMNLSDIEDPIHPEMQAEETQIENEVDKTMEENLEPSEQEMADDEKVQIESIQGQPMNESADYAEYIKNKNNKENDLAQPGFSFSVADEKTDITPETDAKDEPENETTDAIDEPNEELLNNLLSNYGDLRGFATWKDYYNSFTEKERMQQMENGEFLDGQAFQLARLSQANETIKICRAKEAMLQAERENLINEETVRTEKKKANRIEIKELTKKIEDLQKEQDTLTKESAANKRQVGKLDRETAKNDAEIKAMEKITKKQKSIEKESKEKAADIEDQVNKVMQEINNNVYKSSEYKAPATKTNVTSDDSKEKEVKEEPKTIEPQTVVTLNEPASKEENKKTDDVKADESTNDTWKNAFVDNATDVFAQAEEKINNSDMSKEEKKKEREDLYNRFDDFVEKNFPTETTQNDLINEISDPNTFDESANKVDETAPVQFDDMGLDPNTRAEIGLRANELYNNDSEKRDFNEYLMQAKQELTEQENSKGKTR